MRTCHLGRRASDAIRALRASIIVAVISFTPAASARDLDPFEALSSGRASSVAPPVARASSAPRLRVGVPGGACAPVEEDGTYVLTGVSAERTHRVELDLEARPSVEPSGSAGARATEGHVVLSEPVRVTAGGRASASFSTSSLPSLVEILLVGPDGRSAVIVPGSEFAVPIEARARTSANGEVQGRIAELASHGVDLVARGDLNLDAQGRVSGSVDGLAWVEAAADGAFARLLVSIDSTHDGDGDGLPDAWERMHGLDPTRDDAMEDPDADGLTNAEELARGLLPRDADTDRDGLRDGDEVVLHGTDPLNPDSDGDLSPDEIEVIEGSDPLDPNERPRSTFTPSVRLTRAVSDTKRVAVTESHRLVFLRTDGMLEVQSLDRTAPLVSIVGIVDVGVEARSLATSFVLGRDHVLVA
ncbi:MAG TPA: hypothetical protein VK116_15645, partial [Planctomycetota bacterium]|nr:hypothetical protein [Planctomycetota bacterium]